MVISALDSIAMAGTTVSVGGAGGQHVLCDADGVFSISNVPYGRVPISFVFMGYRTLHDTITVNKPITELGIIRIDEEAEEMEAIIVPATAIMAVQKGDTTQFNAAAFRTHPDADVETLVAKMPGIIIQEGRVESQGEPVRRIYVDGKLFFGNDVNTALRSLPADAVESIQIFDEQTDQAKYTGFDDGETQKAINIVTRSKRETNYLARIEASAGADTKSPHTMRYLTGGNASRFGKDYRLTVTGLLNNVNSARFGTDDVTGTAAVSGRERDNNGNLLNQPKGISTVGGFGINFSKDTKYFKFSGDYFFSSDNNDYEREGVVNYYPTNKYKTRQSTSQMGFSGDTYQHKLNLRFEYNTKWWTFVFSPNLRWDRNFSNTPSRGLTTQTLQESESLDSLTRYVTTVNQNNENLFANGNLFVARRFAKRGRSLSFNLYFNASSRQNHRNQEDSLRQSYRLTTSQWVNSTMINRITTQENDASIFRFRLAYTEPLGKFHRIMVSGTLSLDNGQSDKDGLAYNYKTHAFDSIDARQTNSLSRDYLSGQGGVGYVFAKKNWRVTASVDFAAHRQLVDNYWLKWVNSEGSTYKDSLARYESNTRSTFTDVQPLFSLRYSLAKTKFLRIEYRGRSVLPRADQLQSLLNDNDPYNLRAGNPNLKQGYENRLTLFYNVANIKKSTNLTVSLQAVAISDYIAQSTVALTGGIPLPEYDNYIPNNNALLTRPINLDGYRYLQATGTYSFVLRPIKSNMNVSGSYMLIRSPSFYHVLNYANINTAGLRVGLSSNISHNVDFNIYSSTSINFTTNSDPSRTNTSYINQNTYASTNIIFPGGIVLNTLFSWKLYRSRGEEDFNDDIYTLNVGIGKRLFRNNTGEVRITVYDILEQNKNILHYVRDNSVEDAVTNTLGRYVMARFSYRFNTMSSKYVATKPAKVKPDKEKKK